MNRRTFWNVRHLAIASVFALWHSSAQATLIVGFKFADNSTSVVVPATGGTYTVNIIAVTDNAAVSSLGISSVYWGAISSVLNSNLGNATLDGDVTAQSIATAIGSSGLGSFGDVGDVNGDGRDDLGPLANSSISNRSGGGGSHPWWVVGQNAGPSFYANAASAILGTFTVTIPAYSPNGNSGDFLKFTPQLQASTSLPALSYDNWTEVTSISTTNRIGRFSTATGTANSNIGSGVTFQAVPEPATFVLLALGTVGLLTMRRASK